MMNVAMCGDSRVYYGLELVIYSMLTHNKNINFYILTMDVDVQINEHQISSFSGINEIQKKKLQDIVTYLDKNSNIVFIDVLSLYEEYLADSVNADTPFTPYASLRLILDIVLPFVDDILYLDCDLGFCRNIEAMYNDCKNNSKHYAYATYSKKAFGGEGEMVSGIMFFNLKKIRENGFFERARHNYRATMYEFPDQGALRDAGEIEQLEEAYGIFYDYRKYKVNPAIIHFTCFLSPKIYNADSPNYFYKVFPEFKYVQDGLRLMDTINGFD